MAQSTMLGSFSQIQTIDTINMKLPHSMGSHSNSVLSNSNLTSQMTKRQKFKLEPIKILEPSNKKLNLPESQRIVFIIEELIHRLEILDYVTLVTTNDDKIRRLISNNLSEDEKKRNYENMFVSMCQHHRTLVETYNRGDYRRNESGQTRESLEMLIKSSCKDILRFLLKKNQFFEDIKKEFAKNIPPTNPKIAELKSNTKFI
jgi:hypothetical protein